MKISNEMIMIILYLVQFFKRSFEFIKFYSKFKIGKRLRLITLYVKAGLVFLCVQIPLQIGGNYGQSKNCKQWNCELRGITVPMAEKDRIYYN